MFSLPEPQYRGFAYLSVGISLLVDSLVEAIFGVNRFTGIAYLLIRKMMDKRTTTDHFKIWEWIDERHGYPAIIAGSSNYGEPARLRIDFPGHSVAECLQRISWKTFFHEFERSDLRFLYQDRTHIGDLSRFYKFLQHNCQDLNYLYVRWLASIKFVPQYEYWQRVRF